MALPFPGLHFVQVKAEEVEPLFAPGELGDAGLIWVQLKSQRSKHRYCSPLGLFGPLAGPAHDDKVVGVPDQNSQLPAFCRPHLI